MNITNADIKKLYKTYRGKLIKLSSGKYYCKYNLSDNNFSSLSYAVNELIAYYVLKELKIISPRYYIVLIDEEKELYSLVSKAINEQGQFYKASDIGLKDIDGTNLYSLWFYLNEHFIKDPNLYIDIIKMYLFDIFFLNVDRHVNNFGFIVNKGHYSLGLLDNEEILLYDNFVPLINATFEGDKWYQELKEIQNNPLNKKEDLELVIINNIRAFLNDSSKEYIELFENMYKMLSPEYLEELLKKIEKENVIYSIDGPKCLIIPQKEELLKRYQRNYNLITDVFNKYKEERRMR